MTDAQVADALIAWADATLPDVIGTSDHLPASFKKGSPVAAVGITRRALVRTDGRFMRAAQQELLDVRDCELFVAVKPEPAKTAIERLQAFADLLLVSLRHDQTLGARVEYASPLCEVDYELGEAGGFVELSDGSPARAFALRFGVCERVPEP